MTSPATESESLLPSLRRMRGMALRHFYLYLGSWPRLAEMMYWPMLNIALYGFVSLAMVRQLGHADVRIDAFLGGLILAEILSRTVMAMLVMYMEEVWSRNLGHLFASPLRLRDFVAGLLSLGVARCLISVAPACLVVYGLFDFSILRLGWQLPVYVALLCFNGCWYGLLIVSIIMRFGLAAEWLGWMSTWILMPFMAPYYPVSVLPHAFQAVSWILPGTYIFAGMKSQLVTGAALPHDLMAAFFLNLGYFVLAGWVFTRAFRSARRSGGLLQMGE